mmetsp:Transcript_64781/g.119171  ORF Transcript_64781/g.119171 Transcript_64781/m.119171 type:complete len:102 (+) Transcript_64781:20-325(+)
MRLSALEAPQAVHVLAAWTTLQTMRAWPATGMLSALSPHTMVDQRTKRVAQQPLDTSPAVEHRPALAAAEYYTTPAIPRHPAAQHSERPADWYPADGQALL